MLREHQPFKPAVVHFWEEGANICKTPLAHIGEHFHRFKKELNEYESFLTVFQLENLRKLFYSHADGIAEAWKGHPANSSMFAVYRKYPFALVAALAEDRLDENGLMAAFLFPFLAMRDKGRALIESFGDETLQLAECLFTLIYDHPIKPCRGMDIGNHINILKKYGQDIRVLVALLEHQKFLLLHMDEMTAPLDAKEAEKRKNTVIDESKYLYAPLASCMDLHELSTSLKNMAFKHEDPANYLEMFSMARQYYKGLNAPVRIGRFLDLLHFHQLKLPYRARIKTPVDMRDKMKRGEEIKDPVGVMLVANNEREYILAFEVASRKYAFLEETFDKMTDSGIPRRKAVFGIEGLPVEVQFYDKGGYATCRHGKMAHWVYRLKQMGMEKELFAKNKGLLGAFSRAFREHVIGLRQGLIDKIGPHSMNGNGGQILVFTPLGKVIALPEGATALDFAYAVHTGLGVLCKWVTVNGEGKLSPHEVLPDLAMVNVVKGEEGERLRTEEDLGRLVTPRARKYLLEHLKKTGKPRLSSGNGLRKSGCLECQGPR